MGQIFLRCNILIFGENIRKMKKSAFFFKKNVHDHDKNSDMQV